MSRPRRADRAQSPKAESACQYGRPLRRFQGIAQKIRTALTRRSFAGRRDRILEIDDNDVRADREALLELARAVCRNEEQ